MRRIRQAATVCAYNFRQWYKNPRIFITFALAFIMCFLLSDKAVKFAESHGTIMQVAEAFVWTFGDANSILLSSLLLVLLFADMPFITSATPFYLVRINRGTWMTGQILYICAGTIIYMAFILAATSLVCAHNAYIGNIWSETAAVLGYSGAGDMIFLPASVKTMEMSTPYECLMWIFILMTLYTLLAASIMLAVNLRKGTVWGMVSVFIFSAFGLLLNPEILKQILSLPDEMMYKANIAFGWLSPLNHATYHMHNFGYDLLPRLWQSCAVFGAAIIFLFIVSLVGMRKYNFTFTGTENA